MQTPISHPAVGVLLAVVAAACLAGCGGSAPAELDLRTLPDDVAGPPFDLTVVALPDTQIYARDHPEIFAAQIQWIVDNREKERIAFVTHLGDIVHNGDRPEEWAAARSAMDLLDSMGVPYGLCLGNHDTSDTNGYREESSHDNCADPPQAPCAGDFFITNFGPSRFVDRPWYGGASPSALSNYQLVEVQGQELMFLHLPVDPWAEEVEWAERMIRRHPLAAVALSTHRYLFDFRMTEEMPTPLPILSARRFDEFVVNYIQGLYSANGWIAEQLYQDFIRVNPQVYMVQCGHIDAEYYQASENVAGQPVHEMLVDFQCLPPDGGNGWMRLLRYDLDAGQIHVETYSPTLGRFRENGEGCDFSLELVRQQAMENRELIEIFTDIQIVDDVIDRWSNTAEGRSEFCGWLYDGGQRDSDFVFDIDFSQYVAPGR